MKITYANDFQISFKSYCESFNILTNYNNFKKSGQFKNKNKLLTFFIDIIIFYLIFCLYFIFIYEKLNINFITSIITIALIICAVVYLFCLFAIIINYFQMKISYKETKKAILEIDKNGIQDKNDTICISSLWEQMQCIVFGKNIVYIFTNSNTHYVFPITIKDKLLKGIKKYNTNDNIKIINK